RPKTLFATHYHELNEMEKEYPRIFNFNVAVKEIGGKVVFVRTLEKGGSEHSFGIHVAKLAGMPATIVKRAGQVLAQLEESAAGVERKTPTRETFQTTLFQLDDPLLSQIRDRLLDVDVNTLTPLQALNTLNDLQSLLTGK
ncbi:MAG: DNA mismatch repair protein MutS, partial [Muribaculaceae bacterium]|nr:DNA mismatch repair protein MutS [Muribaculaceae bacterium]